LGGRRGLRSDDDGWVVGDDEGGGEELLSANEVASYLTYIYYLFSNLHRNEVIGDIDSSDSDSSVDIFNYNRVSYVPLAR
jgi:hypothetical protein